MQGKIKYEFSAELWQHGSDGGWHFVSLPKSISNEIRAHLKWQEEGWGRMKAVAQIGESRWETAIWFDTKKDTYLLPVKAAIREKSWLELDKEFEIVIWI